MPEAKITLVDVAKGISRAATTDAEGRYHFTALSPAAYDVRGEHPGFETQVKKGAAITVGQTAIIDFALKLSPVHNEVER